MMRLQSKRMEVIKGIEELHLLNKQKHNEQRKQQEEELRKKKEEVEAARLREEEALANATSGSDGSRRP